MDVARSRTPVTAGSAGTTATGSIFAGEAGAKAGVRGVPGTILGPPPGPQLAPFPGQASPPPRARGNNPPRPPAPVGPSALAPGLFSR